MGKAPKKRATDHVKQGTEKENEARERREEHLLGRLSGPPG